MTEEIKEILDSFTKFKDKWYSCEYILKPEQCILLLDYITNLQQDLDKANDIIEKDRQFYKCRMDEYVDLKKENEELKQTLHNITINGVEEENTTVLDLINENEKLKEQLQNKGIIKTCENCEWFGTCPHSYREYDYKQRNEKAIKYINNNKLYDFDYDKEELFEIVSDKIAKEYLLNILNGENNE